MAYQVAPGDPFWELDVVEFERKAAQFLKTNGVTTNAQRQTFIDAASQAQINAGVKALFNCLKVVAG